MSADAKNSYGVKPVKASQYNDLPYSREVVDKAEVLALIREALGLNQGEASKLVFDGKVSPVVVLNDSTIFSRWDLKWSYDTGVAFDRDIFVDNQGYVYMNGDPLLTFDVNGNLLSSIGCISYWHFGNSNGMNGMQCKKYLILLDVKNDGGANDILRFFRNGVNIYNIDLGTQTFASCIGYSSSGKYVVCGDGSVMYFYEGVV